MKEFIEDNVGKYPCLTRDCKKVLLSKQGLEAHQKIHEEKEYICNDCEKSFSLDLCLKQHISGKHGEGSLSFVVNTSNGLTVNIGINAYVMSVSD